MKMTPFAAWAMGGGWILPNPMPFFHKCLPSALLRFAAEKGPIAQLSRFRALAKQARGCILAPV